jgi:type I restriction enzyme, R subunit
MAHRVAPQAEAEPNIPIAIIEAKDNNHSVGYGMRQALILKEALKV